MTSSSKRCLKLLEKCRNLNQLRQAHAQTITCGLKDNSFALSRLLAWLSSNPIGGGGGGGGGGGSHSLHYSWKLFKNIQNPTTCICNTMLKSLSFKGETFPSQLFKVYTFMLRGGILPDAYTFSYLLKGCSKLGYLWLGEAVHGYCLKLGSVVNNFVGNCLIDVYSGVGDVEGARRVFDEVVVVGSCGDVVSWTLMVSGYAKAGDVGTARLLFDAAPCKDVGVWGAMVSGYVQNNCFKEGLFMFRLMQLSGLVADEGILSNVLCACAQLGALDSGVWIHRYLERIGLGSSVRLRTGLIDMYAKCGNLGLAKGVFEGVKHKDAVCWNAMIFGMALHGDGHGALALFSQMEQDGCRPDELTLVAVLTACSHSGMGREGLRQLDRMCFVYGIEPKKEHYGCVVDLLTRSGLFKEAEETVKAMPSGSTSSEEAVAWRTLLSACCNQEQADDLAEVVAEKLLQLERHSGVYVLLSNRYAAMDKHEDAKKIRKMMKNRGIEKTPGCSSIKVNGVNHEFVAGEKSHPCMEEIIDVLMKLNKQFGSSLCNPS